MNMGKMIRITLIALLVALLLLSLPFLYVFIRGSITGSFEWFPNSDDAAMKRGIYIICSIMIISVDVFLGIILSRLIKGNHRF